MEVLEEGAMKFKIGDKVRNIGSGLIQEVVDIVDYKGMTPADSGMAYKLVDDNGQTFLLVRDEETMERIKIKAIYATLEPSSHNTDGVAATVYFDTQPSEEDVKFAFSDFTDLFRKSQGGAWPNLGPIADDNGNVDAFWEAPNAISRYRYQAMVG